MEPYFNVRGYVPGGIVTNRKKESLDIEALPPFLRVLLITDGTVTKSLEAFYWEHVAVESIRQSEVALADECPWLDLKKGDRVLEREVRLVGKDSGVVYAYCKSLLKLDALSEQLRSDLLSGKIGIGEMLRERGLETYREVVDMGRKIDETLAPMFNTTKCGDLIYRTYRVRLHHEPTMLITEDFPYRLFAKQRFHGGPHDIPTRT